MRETASDRDASNTKYIMKPTALRFVAIAVFGLFLGSIVIGCRSDPIQKTKDVKVENKADPFRGVHEAFRYNAGTSDDWTRFREGLKLIESYFSRADVVNRLTLTADERKFLQGEANLSNAEFTQIEPAAFQLADAHYLDECYLLHDAFVKLEERNTKPIQQANLCFNWVVRNVMLHEQVDDWMPPAFALRRGYGGSMERSLVFLSLLRQARLEGCLVVVPDAEPKQLLVGVLEPKTTNLRLFDPRLGLPVMSKDGTSIATLQEVVADPALLAPSGISAEQAKKLETWLACPLFALAPRMRELQDKLSAERLTLHLNAPALFDDVKKASPLPVKVWNPPLTAKVAANSPTRCLWTFLPKREGGVDNGNRFLDYNRSLMPLARIIVNLEAINIIQRDMPRLAWITLIEAYHKDLFNKYDAQPREMMLRGLRDPMVRRQHRMELFVDVGLAGLDKNAAFEAKEVRPWVELVKNVYANLDDDPKKNADNKKLLAAVWGQDPFFGYLLEVDKDDFNRQNKNEKANVLTKILAVSSRDYFVAELPRMEAAANHEVAMRYQARVDAVAKPSDYARKDADEAWSVAKTSWSNNYFQKIPPLQNKVDQALSQLQRNAAAGRAIDIRLSLLEDLHLDLQKYFNARLRLGECLSYTEAKGAQAAARFHEETKNEIEALERQGPLKAEIADLSQALSQAPEPVRIYVQRRLDLLARDWSDGGNYYWTKKHIDRIIAK